MKEKYTIISYIVAHLRDSTDARLLASIQRQGRGAVFCPARFLHLGSRSAIDTALHRLARRGAIRRLARGLYDYPRMHATLGPLSPHIDDIARALEARGGIRLMPAGDYAANILRLSDHVPARITFLTDGASRRLRIGTRDIVLKHTAPRYLALAGRKSGLVIQALRYLGKTNVTQGRLAPIQPLLSDQDRHQLARDSALAPAWMRPYLRTLAGEASA